MNNFQYIVKIASTLSKSEWSELFVALKSNEASRYFTQPPGVLNTFNLEYNGGYGLGPYFSKSDLDLIQMAMKMGQVKLPTIWSKLAEMQDALSEETKRIVS